ncbi:MerR family transcriptional regulator [Ammoniphilus sp. CFH 90114]|uniref:MerR family transcriptional regulator n=1 Tax=Ammoniphilus sp. CFH 90114 TaxID=2493665 RepID=UPI00100EB7C9|nr:MerR family transcriptional regulator [Ammoniphilus sp. CFH 90114]RXT06313.1 MerR family transcriptional regulator [Ammoniphilus sp. CFH 90114]
MYPIKKVSELTGIPAVTIRAWERRYGLGPSERTEGGHRLYSENDVLDLKWLKKQTEEVGVNISQAVQLLAQRKQQAEKAVTSSSSRELQELDLKRMDTLYESLIALDSNKASEALELSFAVWPIETVLQNVLPQLLHRIGDEWEKGNISVAQEHFASNWIMHRISHLLRVFPVDKTYPRALALCPPGEHHQVGLLLFTLFLRRKGMDVVYLGPDTPENGLDKVITDLNIGLVCISITRPDLQRAVRELISQLTTEHPGLKFVIGGQGMLNAPESLQNWNIGHSSALWDQWFDLEWMR